MYKICYITTVSITLKSFVIGISQHLHENGEFDITFICNPDIEFEKSLPSYIHFIPVEMNRGINIQGIKVASKLYKIFQINKFDLIQYSTPNASFYAAMAGWLSRVPIRLYCQWGIAYVRFKGIKRGIFKIIEKAVCQVSTCIEPDSYGNLKFSLEEGLYPITKGSVVWNGSASGVDIERFNVEKKAAWRDEIREQYKIPTTAFVFGFVGRINVDKGINELFSATKTIMSNYKNCWLILVGEVEKSEKIDKNLYNWSLNEKHVVYAKYQDRVERFYSAMDVFILPSYREGFGSTIIEAEAMEVPVIVTDIPGPTQAMKKDITGLVVKKGDIESLLEAMDLLYSNAALRIQYGEDGRKFAESSFEQKGLFKRIEEDRMKLLRLAKKKSDY